MSTRPVAGDVWSATPTPFDPDCRLDAKSVRRMVEHGLKELLVQRGIFSHSASLLEYPLTDVYRAQIHAAVSGADGLGFRADLFENEPKPHQTNREVISPAS